MSSRNLMTFCRQGNIPMPKPIAAAVAEREKIRDAYPKYMAANGTDLARAIVEALAADTDPAESPEVQAAVIADALTRRDMESHVNAAAEARLDAAILQHADALRAAIEATFTEHAERLTECHRVLGDVDLKDYAAIVSRGGTAAQSAVDARTAMQALNNVLAAVENLAEFTGQSLTAGADMLAEFTPEQWIDYPHRSDRDPWHALRAGARLRLATREDQSELREAVESLMTQRILAHDKAAGNWPGLIRF